MIGDQQVRHQAFGNSPHRLFTRLRLPHLITEFFEHIGSAGSYHLFVIDKEYNSGRLTECGRKLGAPPRRRERPH
ncbi:hypothetical protein ASE72_18405 [Sphingomonas sp. Leaf20]|nr:hypothetical protein ASE72_18405 [Sphingomonas sp. Leaf20]